MTNVPNSINWRPRSSHSKLFDDGERMLVAVPCCDRKDKSQTWWCIAVITIHCDEGFFEIEEADDMFGWDWADVEWWVPLKEIEPREKP